MCVLRVPAGKTPPKVEETTQDTFSNPLSANMSEDDIRATIQEVAAGEEFMSRDKVEEACEKLGVDPHDEKMEALFMSGKHNTCTHASQQLTPRMFSLFGFSHRCLNLRCFQQPIIIGFYQSVSVRNLFFWSLMSDSLLVVADPSAAKINVDSFVGAISIECLYKNDDSSIENEDSSIEMMIIQ